MLNSERRPIRSKAERGLEVDVRVGPDGNGSGLGQEGGAADAGLEELRQAVESHGFTLSRQKGAVRGRPSVEENGRVRITARVSPALRDAMQEARWELGLTVSGFIEEALVRFLDAEGLRAEGLRAPGGPESEKHRLGE